MKSLNFFSKVIFVLFFFSLFFPIRHVFLTKEAYLTGGYSDFTSFSLYLSDILVFLLAILTILPRGEKIWLKIKSLKFTSAPSLFPIFFLTLAIFLVFFIHFGLNIRFCVYLLVKWLELIVAYGTFRILFEQSALKNLFLKLFVWLCGLESIIALVQFARQSSIGLYRLGESHLAPSILGVAKIVSGGTTFIRGYGTFPHPNPFSAFLVASILMTSYLLINSKTKKTAILYSILLFINILGLTVTFSRGAYLALAAGLMIFFGTLYFKRVVIARSAADEAILSEEKIATPSAAFGLAITAIGITLISIVISFFLFKPFLLTRATFSDQSTIARKFYDVIGIKMAEKNPVFGVGLGEGLLHMEQYSNKILAPWDKQPPHNFFIIVAAEMGIPAMLILVWIFLSHLHKLVSSIKYQVLSKNREHTTYYILLATIFICFLILMQFDHYFYTLQQTQMLLWLILGIIAAEIKTKNESTAKI